MCCIYTRPVHNIPNILLYIWYIRFEITLKTSLLLKLSLAHLNKVKHNHFFLKLIFTKDFTCFHINSSFSWLFMYTHVDPVGICDESWTYSVYRYLCDVSYIVPIGQQDIAVPRLAISPFEKEACMPVKQQQYFAKPKER